MFRVCGFYEVICCGVEGVGGVNGSAMVDGLFFVIYVVVNGKQRQWVGFLRVEIGGFVDCWWW